MLIYELSPESLVFVLIIVILPAYIHLWTIKLIYKVFKPLSKNRWGQAWKEGLGASTDRVKFLAHKLCDICLVLTAVCQVNGVSK